MTLAWATALQVASSAAAAMSGEAKPAPIDFDLARMIPNEAALRIGCRGGGGDASEIVVCARRRGGDYPVEEMARRYASKPLMAETGIAPDTSVRAYTESVPMPGGQTSKRAMVGVKLRF
ncbi:MAG TPA: hypothetical protein VF628_04940 [Allosphingosinicella sp.]|jgi:hypothetical protein